MQHLRLVQAQLDPLLHLCSITDALELHAPYRAVTNRNLLFLIKRKKRKKSIQGTSVTLMNKCTPISTSSTCFNFLSKNSESHRIVQAHLAPRLRLRSITLPLELRASYCAVSSQKHSSAVLGSVIKLHPSNFSYSYSQKKLRTNSNLIVQ